MLGSGEAALRGGCCGTLRRLITDDKMTAFPSATTRNWPRSSTAAATSLLYAVAVQAVWPGAAHRHALRLGAGGAGPRELADTITADTGFLFGDAIARRARGRAARGDRGLSPTGPGSTGTCAGRWPPTTPGRGRRRRTSSSTRSWPREAFHPRRPRPRAAAAPASPRRPRPRARRRGGRRSRRRPPRRCSGPPAPAPGVRQPQTVAGAHPRRQVRDADEHVVAGHAREGDDVLGRVLGVDPPVQAARVGVAGATGPAARARWAFRSRTSPVARRRAGPVEARVVVPLAVLARARRP